MAEKIKNNKKEPSIQEMVTSAISAREAAEETKIKHLTSGGQFTTGPDFGSKAEAEKYYAGRLKDYAKERESKQNYSTLIEGLNWVNKNITSKVFPSVGKWAGQQIAQAASGYSHEVAGTVGSAKEQTLAHKMGQALGYFSPTNIGKTATGILNNPVTQWTGDILGGVIGTGIGGAIGGSVGAALGAPAGAVAGGTVGGTVVPVVGAAPGAAVGATGAAASLGATGAALGGAFGGATGAAAAEYGRQGLSYGITHLTNLESNLARTMHSYGTPYSDNN